MCLLSQTIAHLTRDTAGNNKSCYEDNAKFDGVFMSELSADMTSIPELLNAPRDENLSFSNDLVGHGKNQCHKCVLASNLEHDIAFFALVLYCHFYCPIFLGHLRFLP